MKTALGLVWLCVVIAAIWGWIENILVIVHTVDLPITGMFILRCVGIVVAPLGAVLGLFA